jgi:group I intron endonuclease
MGWIYLIRNTVNDKCYVGQTTRKSVDIRWNQHKNHPKGILKTAFAKYGLDCFVFEIICEAPNEELNSREVDEIFKRNSLSPNGYNLKKGGDNHEVHPETRRKLSERQKGEKHWSFGKKASEETCKKRSESLKGDKNPMFGKHRTDEVKHKISLKISGKNNPNFGKPAAEHPSAKEVEHLNDGVWVSHPSIRDASHATGASYRGISECCKGRQEKAGGFEWRYRPVEPNPDAPRSVTSPVNSVGVSTTSATV